MIASLARLAFAPFTLLFDWADRHCAELESTALADAAECPEEIEPPEMRAPSALELCAALDAWADLDNDTIAARIEEWTHG